MLPRTSSSAWGDSVPIPILLAAVTSWADLMLPSTCSLAVGAVVPMPTLPRLVMRKFLLLLLFEFPVSSRAAADPPPCCRNTHPNSLSRCNSATPSPSLWGAPRNPDNEPW